MSRHHRAQRWTTHAPKLRAYHAKTLPAPCIRCTKPVTADQTWHVGHRVPASMGGRPTIANTGPIHASCNLIEGGQLGARITNGKRQAAKDIRAW